MQKPNLSLKATFQNMKRLGDIQMKSIRDAVETEAGHKKVIPPEAFEGRNGYTPAFLEGWNIPIPQLTGDSASDMRELRRGGTGVELKYQNFSIIMSASRRLPLITAVNIDGGQAKKIPRKDKWSFDGRLDEEDQVGNFLYDNNILDRGHMVRREDPNWGSNAAIANDDTFVFPNCCPQIAGINQKVWLGLENYILSHAKSDEMFVNVYTGPIFNENDMVYRDIQIPAAFWKVVAIVTEDGRPSVTAYKISQEKELGELEYVYGPYKTFQISVREVIDLTGLDFSTLVDYDGFSEYEATTGQKMKRTIDSPNDILI